MTMHRHEKHVGPPEDKWKLVFFTFMLHGLGTLMPWNMFITAKDYFVDFKLDSADDGKGKIYATNFLSSIGFASQIPNVILNWLNIFITIKGDLTKRVVCSIIIEVCVFLITIILAMTDSSTWPGAFFWITMLCVVICNMANGIYQNTLYGLVATLPSKYTGAVVLGSNICGVFATLISIGSSGIFESQRRAAIYYFIVALFVLLICFNTYFALPLNRFYRYNELMRNKEALTVNTTQEDTKIPYWKIFKKSFPNLFNVFFVFFVSLSIFPALHSDIHRSSDSFVIDEKYFTAITCFLTFNLFAMLGTLLTSWVQWPKPRYLFIPVVLRILLIPSFLFCNYHPKNLKRTWPVLIANDWIYWSCAIVLSFSSGYLSSLAMMYAPKAVEPKYQIKAGMFAAAFLISGIFLGITFSAVFPHMVSA